MDNMRVIIVIIGWISIFFIQLKYYLQIITLLKTKNVKGLSMNYWFLNFNGYLFLSINYFFKYKYQSIKVKMTEYTDLLMVIHGTIIVFVIILISRFINKGINPLTISGKLTIIIIYSSFLFYYLLKTYIFTDQITTLELVGFQMFLINIFKYISQIIYMKKNKCVKGLNKFYLFCDFLGVFLSLVQYILDYNIYVLKNNIKQPNFYKNYIKLLLIISSIITNLTALFLQKIILNKDKQLKNKKLKEIQMIKT